MEGIKAESAELKKFEKAAIESVLSRMRNDSPVVKEFFTIREENPEFTELLASLESHPDMELFRSLCTRLGESIDRWL